MKYPMVRIGKITILKSLITVTIKVSATGLITTKEHRKINQVTMGTKGEDAKITLLHESSHFIPIEKVHLDDLAVLDPLKML